MNRELQPFIGRFRLPFGLFDELIRGVEMDLDIRRYQTWSELEQYCYRVASVVGLLSIEIFGYTNPACREYADHLGKALQLTNILRDVRIDADATLNPVGQLLPLGDGSYEIVGVNTFRSPSLDKSADPVPQKLELIRSTEDEKRSQLKRLREFQEKNRDRSGEMLERLRQAVIRDENVFAVLMDAVRVCSLGQITHALFEVGGQYRRSM